MARTRKKLPKGAAKSSKGETASLPKTMRFDDYAKHRGVTYSTVYGWHRNQIIKCVSRGLVDVAASDAALAERGGPGFGNKPTIIEKSAPYSHAEAQRVKENYAALARQLEYERDAAKVIEITKVANVVAAKLANVRQKLRSVGSAISPRVVACRSADEAKALIDAEIDRALEEIAAEAAAASST